MSENRVAGFVPQFWIINLVELLERLAYYGALSVLALYLDALGHSGGTVGVVLAIFLPLPYVVGIISGTLAERFGYRAMCAVAFAFYTAGFALLGTFTELNTMGIGILLVGIGSGLFKPIPAAAVSHLTTEENRSLGFSLYYSAINAGALVGPLVIAYLLLGDTSTGDLSGYRYAFLGAAGAMVVSTVVVLSVFRNPTEPQRDASVMDSLIPLGQVFTDLRFLAVMAVYSGFWVLYAMNFTFVPLYLANYVETPSWFAPSSQQALNPLTVIVLGIPLGAVAAKARAMPRMSLGIAFFATGFTIVGLTGTFAGFVIGMVVATIGEVLTHPGYLAFVAQIAPKDRVAIYQSVGFIPIAIGFLVGPVVGGRLFESLVQDAGRPEYFWSIMTAVGLVTVTGFVLLAARGGGVRRRSVVMATAPIVAAALLVTVGASITPEPVPQEEVLAAVSGDLGTWDEALTEGETWTTTVLVNGTGTLVVGLTWTDEAPSTGPLPISPATNLPDEFRVRLLDGDVFLAATTDDDGAILLEWENPGAAVQVTIEVTLVEAGDNQVSGQTIGADTGNTWHLEAGIA